MLKSNSCFFCVHYYHDNPDDDKCRLSDDIVYFDTPACEFFDTGDNTGPGVAI